MTEEEKAVQLEKVIESRTLEQQKAFEKYKSDYVVHASVSGKNRKFVQYFYPDEHGCSGKETLSAAWHFTNVYSKHIKGNTVRRSVRVIPATAVKVQRFDQGRDSFVF